MKRFAEDNKSSPTASKKLKRELTLTAAGNLHSAGRDKISRMECLPNKLMITWGDRHESSFLYVWLRDHCPQSMNSGSKQRQVNSLHILNEPEPKSIKVSDDGESLVIEWTREVKLCTGDVVSKSTFQNAWLRKHCYSLRAQKEREETRPKPLLWSKSPNGFKLPESSSKAIMEEKGRIDALKKLRDYGILLVRNMPTDKYGVQKIAEQFGYVQQTIWGGMWNTLPAADPKKILDTTYTNMELPPHTDCCYLSSPSALQFFCCQQDSDDKEGGQTWCVDGFSVAEDIREKHPETFNFFAKTKFTFYSHSQTYYVKETAPVFELDKYGNIKRFRYNNDDRYVIEDLDEDAIEEFYSKHLPILINTCREGDPRFTVLKRMNIGDMIIFHNLRVMHGRKSFKGNRRNLVGCYIDKDAFESNLRVFGLLE